MPELLSPAGNFEKMKAALLYGADAVYLAGNLFGMRSAADNFTDEELLSAVNYVHERGKKIYLTVNTMPREYEYTTLEKFLHTIKDYGIDAMIIADLGVLDTVKKIIPDMEVHISTQASAVSSAVCRAYHNLGAKRIVLARELTMNEIMEIKSNLPRGLELEAFIHGSMCVSYSGRCTLSNYLTERDANRGACTQPCRWNYALVEEKRPDVPLPIMETENGTFILGSKDMCMIEHIPELVKAGIDSFKIEGRVKSAYYTAVTANAYKTELMRYMANPDSYVFDESFLTELTSVSHREYGTGYFFDAPGENAQITKDGGYIRDKAFLASVESYDAETGRAVLYQRNKAVDGEECELVSPGVKTRPLTLCDMRDMDGNPIESAPHPQMKFSVKAPFPLKYGDIVRGK